MGITNFAGLSVIPPGMDMGSPLTQGDSLFIMQSYRNDKLLQGVSLDGINFTYFDAALTYPVTGKGGAASLTYLNGVWYRAYTTSNGGSNFEDNQFAVEASFNLIDWLVIANPSFSSITTNAGAVWAQMWFQEPGTTTYEWLCVLSAVSVDDTNGPFQIYEVHPTNASLTAWSAPVLITGTGFPANMIDASVIKVGSTYYMFFKNETTTRLGLASSSSLLSGYTIIADGTTDYFGIGTVVEAPQCQQLTSSLFRLYYDHYPSVSFNYIESSDLFVTWGAEQTVNVPFVTQHIDVYKTSDIGAVRTVLGAYLSNQQALVTSGHKVGVNGYADDMIFRVRHPTGGGDVAGFFSKDGNQCNVWMGRSDTKETAFVQNGTTWSLFRQNPDTTLQAFMLSLLPSFDVRVDSGNLVISASGKNLVISNSQTPASSGAAGTTGSIAWDADFLYVCVNTNTWKRVAISTW